MLVPYAARKKRNLRVEKEVRAISRGGKGGVVVRTELPADAKDLVA